MLVALAHVIAVSKAATTAKDFAAWDFICARPAANRAVGKSAREKRQHNSFSTFAGH
jgi:hypothetical protein